MERAPAPTAPVVPRGHIPALDGLRGCAVVAVLAFHFLHLDGLERHPLDRAVIAFAGAGWCGVDLFFVLSGFLITGILLDAKGRDGWLRAFWARRVLRIFPLHYAYLTALFVVAPALASSGALDVAPVIQAWFWAYAGNVLFAVRGTFDGGPSLVAHFWSLAVEEQFYLVWPVVVWALPRRGVAWACVVAIAGAAAVRAALLLGGGHANAAYVLMPARMDALGVGALIATVGRGPRGWSALRRAAPWVVAGGALAVAAVAAWRGALFGGDPMVELIAFTPLAMLFGGVLLRAIDAPAGAPVQRLLASRALCAAGRYSYALYVLHYPAFRLLEAAGFRASALPPMGGSRLPGALAFALVAGALSWALAVASWHALERPFLSLKALVPRAGAASR